MCYNLANSDEGKSSLNAGIRERGAFAGSDLYSVLVKTIPELRGRNNSKSRREPALTEKGLAPKVKIKVEPCKILHP